MSPQWHVPAFPRRACGAALILVLWFVSALSIIAVSLSSRVRVDVQSGGLMLADTRAQALGDAAINLALLEIDVQPPGDGEILVREYVLEGQQIIVQARDDTAFVNLNHAPASLLASLFTHIGGASAEAAEIFAANLLSWRMPSAVDTAASVYASAGSPYRPRGGQLEASEDLMQVLGIDYDLYVRIRPFVTVFGDGAGVDDRQAPVEVLQVLAGGRAEVAERIAQQREGGLVAMDTSMLDKAGVQRAKGSYMRVDARLDIDGVEFNRSRWVQRGGTSLEPWKTLVAETTFQRGNEQASNSR